MTIINPHTLAPVRTDEPEPPKLTESEVLKRYKVTAGRLLIVRDKVDAIDEHLVARRFVDVNGNEGALVAGEQWRTDMAKQFEEWATVLMVGGPYRTDYGTVIDPPDVKPGTRILIEPTAGRDVELGRGDMKMTVTLIGFAAVMLIESDEEGAS